MLRPARLLAAPTCASFRSSVRYVGASALAPPGMLPSPDHSVWIEPWGDFPMGPGDTIQVVPEHCYAMSSVMATEAEHEPAPLRLTAQVLPSRLVESLIHLLNRVIRFPEFVHIVPGRGPPGRAWCESHPAVALLGSSIGRLQACFSAGNLRRPAGPVHAPDRRAVRRRISSHIEIHCSGILRGQVRHRK
jgi:hypothetical protein